MQGIDLAEVLTGEGPKTSYVLISKPLTPVNPNKLPKDGR